MINLFQFNKINFLNNQKTTTQISWRIRVEVKNFKILIFRYLQSAPSPEKVDVKGAFQME